MKANKYRITSVVIITAVVFLLCGFGFAKSVAVDTDKFHVFEPVTAEKLLSDFKNDKASAKKTYNNHYIVLTGKFEKKLGKDKFTVCGENYDSIECSFAKNVSIPLDNYKFDDEISVYGKCIYFFDKLMLTEVESIAASVKYKSSDDYYLADGTHFDISNTEARTLNNGRVKYSIPSEWKEIEKDIKKNDLGNIEGYLYQLDSIDSGSIKPELLFVCYFGKDDLADKSQISRTKDVEKVIIKNIEGDVGSLPFAKKTYYGANYRYYNGVYHNLLGDGCRTEYIFIQDGNNGIVMLLYVYDENTSHLNDIVFLTRFLKIG